MALAPVGAENLCHLGRCVLWAPSARSRVRYVNGRSRPRRACDDRRLMGLKLVFLIVTRAVSLLGLSRRESWWKDAEILMLRHQLAVAEREHPRAHSRDVAGPGVAGAARRDAAHRAPRRDAADLDPGHDLALAPRHRLPPVGAPVASGKARSAADGPPRAGGGGAAGAGG